MNILNNLYLQNQHLISYHLTSLILDDYDNLTPIYQMKNIDLLYSHYLSYYIGNLQDSTILINLIILIMLTILISLNSLMISYDDIYV
jgi:hypothetical protein